MKRFLPLMLIAVVLSCFAFAATQYTRIQNLRVNGRTLLGSSTDTDGITKSFSATSTIDFAAQTATCVDSSNVTVTGAVIGDVCTVGTPVAAAVANSSFSCRVSATNTVLVRFCPAGAGAVDPASGVFYVRTFSTQ